MDAAVSHNAGTYRISRCNEIISRTTKKCTLYLR